MGIEHDERCCMNGVPLSWGPHPDCPGLSRSAPADEPAGDGQQEGGAASAGEQNVEHETDPSGQGDAASAAVQPYR